MVSALFTQWDIHGIEYQFADYEGVSMSSRDANSKRAANEASNIFGSHYPEFLACVLIH
jgi:hypothetical protein